MVRIIKLQKLLRFIEIPNVICYEKTWFVLNYIYFFIIKEHSGPNSI